MKTRVISASTHISQHMIIYCLNDCKTKYCWKFIPYVGKNQQYNHKDSLGNFVMNHLTEPLHYDKPGYKAGRIIFADQYFNSVKTAYNLLKKEFMLLEH